MVPLDKVGHLGDMETAVGAVKTINEALGLVMDGIRQAQGILLVTSDHGNIRSIYARDEDGNIVYDNVPVPPKTRREKWWFNVRTRAAKVFRLEKPGYPTRREMASDPLHTAEPVLFALYDPAGNLKDERGRDAVTLKYGAASGTLADVAPTILEIAGIPKPEVMTGKSVLKIYEERFHPMNLKERPVVCLILDGLGDPPPLSDQDSEDSLDPVVVARAREKKGMVDPNTGEKIHYTNNIDFIRHGYVPDGETRPGDPGRLMRLAGSLIAHGSAVGYPDETFRGESDVCHGIIGAGRKVKQVITKLFEMFGWRHDGPFFEADHLIRRNLEQRLYGGSDDIHLRTMLSDTGLHSHTRTLYAVLELAKRLGYTVDDLDAPTINLHMISDGVDTLKWEADEWLMKLHQQIQKMGVKAEIVDEMGRDLGMARGGGKTWPLTAVAFWALTKGFMAPSGVWGRIYRTWETIVERSDGYRNRAVWSRLSEKTQEHLMLHEGYGQGRKGHILGMLFPWSYRNRLRQWAERLFGIQLNLIDGIPLRSLGLLGTDVGQVRNNVLRYRRRGLQVRELSLPERCRLAEYLIYTNQWFYPEWQVLMAGLSGLYSTQELTASVPDGLSSLQFKSGEKIAVVGLNAQAARQLARQQPLDPPAEFTLYEGNPFVMAEIYSQLKDEHVPSNMHLRLWNKRVSDDSFPTAEERMSMNAVVLGPMEPLEGRHSLDQKNIHALADAINVLLKPGGRVYLPKAVDPALQELIKKRLSRKFIYNPSEQGEWVILQQRVTSVSSESKKTRQEFFQRPLIANRPRQGQRWTIQDISEPIVSPESYFIGSSDVQPGRDYRIKLLSTEGRDMGWARFHKDGRSVDIEDIHLRTELVDRENQSPARKALVFSIVQWALWTIGANAAAPVCLTIPRSLEEEFPELAVTGEEHFSTSQLANFMLPLVRDQIEGTFPHIDNQLVPETFRTPSYPAITHSTPWSEVYDLISTLQFGTEQDRRSAYKRLETLAQHRKVFINSLDEENPYVESRGLRKLRAELINHQTFQWKVTVREEIAPHASSDRSFANASLLAVLLTPLLGPISWIVFGVEAWRLRGISRRTWNKPGNPELDPDVAAYALAYGIRLSILPIEVTRRERRVESILPDESIQLSPLLTAAEQWKYLAHALYGHLPVRAFWRRWGVDTTRLSPTLHFFLEEVPASLRVRSSAKMRQTALLHDRLLDHLRDGQLAQAHRVARRLMAEGLSAKVIMTTVTQQNRLRSNGLQATADSLQQLYDQIRTDRSSGFDVRWIEEALALANAALNTNRRLVGEPAMNAMGTVQLTMVDANGGRRGSRGAARLEKLPMDEAQDDRLIGSLIFYQEGSQESIAIAHAPIDPWDSLTLTWLAGEREGLPKDLESLRDRITKAHTSRRAYIIPDDESRPLRVGSFEISRSELSAYSGGYRIVPITPENKAMKETSPRVNFVNRLRQAA